ncbi:hypothetical protein I5730_04915 [Acinetobacter nosocomialis]|uniref:hypothetical protein n=1 Tax=Acinetobacter nosocomialis TaxID=106654 RepID=UPI0019022ECC|nr:hypothetical protein [Acinetobacter nosocomialis]MBJ9959885.1 hypothetical protein [Acinetobacter nosocomialis]
MSEFEDWAYENGLSRTKDEDGYFSKNTEFASKAWQHQQAKVEELQKRVDTVVVEIEKLYLSGVIGFGTVKKLEQALKGE